VRTALVLGGSGAVGSAVVAELARRGAAVVFTWHRDAASPARLGARGVALDLRDFAAIRALVAGLDPCPSVLVHTAACSPPRLLADATDADWDDALSVNARGALVAVQALAERWTGPADVVFTSALDRAQALPIPVHVAASQGMLGAAAMALGKELGPRGIRVNAVALGPLETGVSRHLSEKQLADFAAFSALRRRGRAEEVAKLVAWLALENTYVNGKTLAANGGI
jgi:NAD(P)-dependent dehydrogenase (short-subunit alcohol dehydrogenase family)